jgi:preprotein translocase subunit SecA
LIDDARTPLIISGPVAKGENQLFDELKPKVESLVSAQRKLVNDVIVRPEKHWLQGY